MRKTFRGRQFYKKDTKEFRVNEKIFAREVMVIDETGANLGVLPRDQAIGEARERGFDLIEVSPKAAPPICKFMDYGSYKYQKEKMERKQKAKTKTMEVKTVKLSFRISQHDLAVRAAQAAKFLDDGDKVKIELQLKGRENQHVALAKETIQKMIAEAGAKLPAGKSIRCEEVTKMGSRLSTIIYI